MLKIGSHISFKAPNYLMGAVKESIKNKANAMMIYLGAPQNAKRVDTSLYKYEEYKNLQETIQPKDIVVHAPYIINPGSLDKYKFAEEFLIAEIKRMNYFGAKYLVLHPGAHTKYSKEESLATVVKTLKNVLKNTNNVEILLETMAGKGTELGATFSEIEMIINQVKSQRIGVCLDTCHVWEAGYDITKYSTFINDLRKNNLLDKIKVIHVNDSKNPIGARKDRHENIGKGFIGLKTLRNIVHSPEFKNAIKILETPLLDGMPIYDKEIQLLK